MLLYGVDLFCLRGGFSLDGCLEWLELVGCEIREGVGGSESGAVVMVGVGGGVGRGTWEGVGGTESGSVWMIGVGGRVGYGIWKVVGGT